MSGALPDFIRFGRAICGDLGVGCGQLSRPLGEIGHDHQGVVPEGVVRCSAIVRLDGIFGISGYAALARPITPSRQPCFGLPHLFDGFDFIPAHRDEFMGLAERLDVRPN